MSGERRSLAVDALHQIAVLLEDAEHDEREYLRTYAGKFRRGEIPN